MITGGFFADEGMATKKQYVYKDQNQKQRAKKVVSDSPGLMDFAIGQVNCLKSILLIKTFLGLLEMSSGVRASCKNDFLYTLKSIIF